jgi:hypothetical protein
MRPLYIALPQALSPHGWMVFHRTRCRAIACHLTRGQARTLADALNLAAQTLGTSTSSRH